MNNAKMIGTDAGRQGCGYGRRCTCNGPYQNKATTRAAKRRERQAWKKETQ